MVTRESTYKRNLGKAIIEMRDAAGLSQAELASAVGKTPAALSRWETGKANPRAYDLYRIAEACRVPVDAAHLFIWPPNPPARPVSKRLRDAREEGARKGLSLVDPLPEDGSTE